MIIVIESQCWGLEHASFNAAFLSTINFSDSGKIIFFSEKSHYNAITEILKKYDPAVLANLEHIEIEIPKRSQTGWLRLFNEWPLIKRVLNYTVEAKSKNIIFTSVTNTGIFSLRFLLNDKHNFHVLVGLHGMLARISGRLPIKPWNWIFSIKFIFNLNQPKQLKYLVFGESIYKNIKAIKPKIIDHFHFIDLPNFEYGEINYELNPERQQIIFGYIGTGNLTKGISLFASIAIAVKRLSHNVEFLLVGYLSSWRTNTDYSAITGLSEVPLTTQEYVRRGLSITYAVNTSNPEFYKYGGCSSFIDALFFGKPGIYLRNDYIEYYFSQMGNIGYLCDTYEELLGVIEKISLNFPEQEYKIQVLNIQNGRKLLMPKKISLKLSQILSK